MLNLARSSLRKAREKHRITKERCIRDFREVTDRCLLLQKCIGDWRSCSTLTGMCFFDHLHTLAICGCKVNEITLEQFVGSSFTNKKFDDDMKRKMRQLMTAWNITDMQEGEGWIEEGDVWNNRNQSVYERNFL